MNQPKMTLIVIRSSTVSRVVEFYRCLGIDFTEERHETGPLHFAACLGGLVFEVYPAKNPTDVDRRTRLGFSTSDLSGAMNRLRTLDAEVLQQPSHSTWGVRAVVRDPDGRTVELYGDHYNNSEPDGIAHKISETIGSIYLRPQMYVGSRAESRALESVLSMMHWMWAEATCRVSDFQHVRLKVSAEEECGSLDFDGSFRRRSPSASDEVVGEYVLSCWQRISSALGIVRTLEAE